MIKNLLTSARRGKGTAFPERILADGFASKMNIKNDGSARQEFFSDGDRL